MTDVIDWSKAPEWADKHGFVGTCRNPAWLNDSQYTYVDGQQGGRAFYFGGNGYSLNSVRNVTSRPQPAQRSGEGLPPVGTVCEYNLMAGPWYRCEVRYILDSDKDPDADGWTAVIWCSHLEKEQIARYGNIGFRPIRTPEQIAADDREAAILVLIKDAGKDVATASFEQARRIYDAGWRKQ